MKTKVFAIYDHKASVYGTPFFMVNHAMAVRAFGDLAEDERTTVGKHPEDFTLYQVGEFDDGSGTLVDLNPKLDLGLATSFKKPGMSVVK